MIKLANDKIRKFSVKYLHVIDNPVYAYFFLKSILKYDYKVIYTLHDFIPHAESNLLKNFKRFICIKLNKKILNLSLAHNNLKIHVHEELSENYYNKKVIVSQHPLYLQVHNKNIKSLDKGICFGFFGRLSYNKGFDIFSETVALINSKTISNVSFIIAGEGSVNLSLKNYENIKIFSDFIDDNLFDELVSEVDYIIMPYRDITQSGILLKAVSNLKPIIASSCIKKISFIKDNEIGYFLEDNNSKSITELINSIVNQNDSKRELFINNLKSIREDILKTNNNLYLNYEH